MLYNYLQTLQCGGEGSITLSVDLMVEAGRMLCNICETFQFLNGVSPLFNFTSNTSTSLAFLFLPIQSREHIDF